MYLDGINGSSLSLYLKKMSVTRFFNYYDLACTFRTRSYFSTPTNAGYMYWNDVWCSYCNDTPYVISHFHTNIRCREISATWQDDWIHPGVFLRSFLTYLWVILFEFSLNYVNVVQVFNEGVGRFLQIHVTFSQTRIELKYTKPCYWYRTKKVL